MQHACCIPGDAGTVPDGVSPRIGLIHAISEPLTAGAKVVHVLQPNRNPHGPGDGSAMRTQEGEGWLW
jgi:hypothetical protein